MRCSMCGAQLKKEGDICNKCYKEYEEYQNLKRDDNVLYKVNRKYLPKFQLTQNWDVCLIFLLVILTLLGLGGVGQSLLALLIFILVIGIVLFWHKSIAKGTVYTFYENSIKYNLDFLFIHREKIIKKSDVTEVKIYQTRRQKWFGLGDIRIYTKGNFLMNGIDMRNIANVLEAFEKVKGILNKE